MPIKIGAPLEYRPAMRALAIASLIVVGCGGELRPSVVPTLSSLPADPQERGEALDSAARRPGPETQPRRTSGEQKLETAAASAAAFVGILLSTSANACLGIAAPFEENAIVEVPIERPGQSREDDGDDQPVFGPTLD